jgi:hypothetical protein
MDGSKKSSQPTIEFTTTQHGIDTIVVGTDGINTWRTIAMVEEGPKGIEEAKKFIEKVFSNAKDQAE